MRSSWASFAWSSLMTASLAHADAIIPSRLEAERKPGSEQESGAVGRASELRPRADIPHHARCQLDPEADLHANRGRLSTPPCLLGKYVANECRASELGRSHRVTEAQRKIVPALALVVPRRGHELVARIEVEAEALDRLRHDALHLDAKAVAADARRRVETNLQGQCRKAERLLVEVVQGTEVQVAGARAVVDLPRVSQQGASQADLEVRQRAIEHF